MGSFFLSWTLRPTRTIVSVIVASLLATGLVGPAQAQTASQITPKTFAPPIQSEAHGLSLGVTPGLDTPPGAEALYVTLKSVSIDGEFPTLADHGDEVRRLAGKRVSGADIFAAARSLEAAYAKAGFVLVRVVLPPQRLDDGAQLTLRVVDGYISRIDTGNIPARVRRKIAALVKPLSGVHALSLKAIERQILLASDVPGVVLRSTLMPGPQTGETILVLNASYQPMTFYAGADNSLGSALGSHQFFVGADYNSVLGLGEKVYWRLSGNPGEADGGPFATHPRNRSAAGGIIVPIGPDGMTLNVEAVGSSATPKTIAGAQVTDDFQRLSFRLRYGWLRSRNADFSSQIVFDAQREDQSLIVPVTLPLFEDRLRVLRLVQEGRAVTRWGGVMSGSFNASFGIGGLGARLASQADAGLPLSRQGASASFTKIDGDLYYGQSLAPHLAASVSARGQYAVGSTAMERAEQIGIAGPGALSAFDSGTLQGDSGFIIRGELSAPVAMPWPSRKTGAVMAPYLFAAGGQLFVKYPTAVEPSRIDAAAYGLGLRLNASSAKSLSNQSVSLELSRRTQVGTTPRGYRFTFSASLRF